MDGSSCLGNCGLVRDRRARVQGNALNHDRRWSNSETAVVSSIWGPPRRNYHGRRTTRSRARGWRADFGQRYQPHHSIKTGHIPVERRSPTTFRLLARRTNITGEIIEGLRAGRMHALAPARVSGQGPNRFRFLTPAFKMADAAVKTSMLKGHRLTQAVQLMEGNIEAVILPSPRNTLQSRATATTPATRTGPTPFPGGGYPRRL